MPILDDLKALGVNLGDADQVAAAVARLDATRATRITILRTWELQTGRTLDPAAFARAIAGQLPR